ncbi:MFS transporter [Brevibacillus composti]|uniref:MFS transporter n=1 Tax=Brevibacillus composti TaxID=2796470 RepID=A0A7T5EM14_9BACL|nr:MFS transporter [Brevibacillus composti]QQE75101.1 MFS transporter [Brevibacillus composti]QUO42188.1 MFS transporter [Brevibacillus composti]
MKHLPERPNGKKEVIMLAAVTALCMLGDSMLYVVLPLYWREAGLSSLWEVGVLLSVNRLVRVPLNPLVNLWYMRSGGRSGLIAAVLLACVSTASYALEGFWLWLAMRCAWGLAWTFLRLGAFSLIVEVSDDSNRGQLMGLYNGIFRLGSLIGMMLGAVLAAWGGLQGAALVFAFASLLALFPVLFSIRPHFIGRPHGGSAEDDGGEGRCHNLRNRQWRARLGKIIFWRSRSAEWRIWRNGWVRTMLAGWLVAMCFQGMFAASLSRVIEEFHPVMLVGGLVLGPAVIAGIVQGVRWLWEPWAAPWFGTLSDRWGRNRLFVLTMAAFWTDERHGLSTLYVGIALVLSLVTAGWALGQRHVADRS